MAYATGAQGFVLYAERPFWYEVNTSVFLSSGAILLR